MPRNDYITERNRKYLQKARIIIEDLPPFYQEFFQGTADIATPLTQYAYALDLRTFFRYITQESTTAYFHGRDIHSLTLEDLNELQTIDIEGYLAYLTYYTCQDNPNVSRENHASGKLRKLSSLRAMIQFFVRREKISRNVATIVNAPKLKDKPIIRLEIQETAELLQTIEEGTKLQGRQQAYHKQTSLRDLTMITLFLSTGIRISELVGLNIEDINFQVNGFRITRKGGNQVILYFNEEMADLLKKYLKERRKIEVKAGHEDALFLSIQRRRITPRSVQHLVKKYTQACIPLKNISPHKLRSTFGTMLYQETGDIYLVADVLGHKDVNTTKKHYAEQSDLNRRKAANAIRLR